MPVGTEEGPVAAISRDDKETVWLLRGEYGEEVVLIFVNSGEIPSRCTDVPVLGSFPTSVGALPGACPLLFCPWHSFQHVFFCCSWCACGGLTAGISVP